MTALNRIRQVFLTGVMLALAGCAMSPDAPPVLASPGPERVFATPQQAADALADANRRDDKAALLAILGPDGEKLISSGDKVADRESRAAFVKAYDAAHDLEPADADQQTLIVGTEEWPLPIPLVHVTGGWQFDTSAGAQEILDRRIGRDEIFAIQICRVYVEAQREYAAQHPLPDGSMEYAQHFISRPGKRDGLYWPTKPGEPQSPFGPLVADARAEGYGTGKKHGHHPRPYHGYIYKILTAQGDNAAGGAQNYIAHGHMTGGFALLAFPARYGDTGIMSFIVDQNGVVFQKNLGPDTKTVAAQMTSYDPDADWDVAKLTP
jgi:hypothetical protein